MNMNELKEKLQHYGFEKLNLVRKFHHVTNGGDAVYELNLFYIEGNKLYQVNYLLKGMNCIRFNKQGYCFGYSQVWDYIAYYIPELEQTRL